MKIASIKVFQVSVIKTVSVKRLIFIWKVDIPLKNGPYKWGGGKSLNLLDATIVIIETDTGIEG